MVTFPAPVWPPERLHLLALLAVRPRSIGQLAEDLHTRPSKVLRHVRRLAGAGLVPHVDRPSLDAAALRGLVPTAPPPAPRVDGDARVLRSFLQEGRLVSIPAMERKLVVVLRHLVDSFELGRTYTEREANAVLQRFHPDHCTLRRQLVDHRLLARESGRYWRLS